MQINNEAPVFQVLPASRIQDSTTTCGQDDIALGGKTLDGLRLPATKSRFAFDLENNGDSHPRSGLDFMVTVMKRQPQSARKGTTHSGLSCAGHADKEKIVGRIH
jgi:hypothetical protein